MAKFTPKAAVLALATAFAAVPAVAQEEGVIPVPPPAEAPTILLRSNPTPEVEAPTRLLRSPQNPNIKLPAQPAQPIAPKPFMGS